MQKADRFHYEASRWSAGQPDQAKRWFDELEMIGAQNVRARLAQVNAGSGASLPIGASQMTIGFAQEWLAWHDRSREALEAERHNRQVFWTLRGFGRHSRRGQRRDRLGVDDLSQVGFWTAWIVYCQRSVAGAASAARGCPPTRSS